MTTRDTVLTRIRRALADVADHETPEDVHVPRGYSHDHAGTDDVVGLFVERAADYQATVTLTAASHAAGTISAVLAGRRISTLIVPPGFPELLLPKGSWSPMLDDPPLGTEELESADGVLTTAAAAIAVTGTIVLDTGPGQGRRALTLLPDYHLCVIEEKQIVGDIPGALALLNPAKPLTFISGPSATSDIELNRVEGVHGPRTLDIVVVQADQQADQAEKRAL